LNLFRSLVAFVAVPHAWLTRPKTRLPLRASSLRIPSSSSSCACSVTHLRLYSFSQTITLAMSSEEVVLPIPNLQLAEHAFVLSKPTLSHLHEKAREELLAGIRADQMAPYYRTLTSATEPVLALDRALLEELEKVNKEELDKLEERLVEAEKMEGETDVVDILRAKAALFTKIGDKVIYTILMNNR
jgi:hypothetical protein